jgi:hypothetical protein
MKLTEIHKPTMVTDTTTADAEIAWERWYDEHPGALDDVRAAYPEYKTTQREKALKWIMSQLLDYTDRTDLNFYMALYNLAADGLGVEKWDDLKGRVKS